MDSPLEILDLVDLNDHVIGVMERGDVYAQKLTNFRVINVFLRNTDNKLFIPRRQLSKRLFPGRLDVSAGGHVSSGETYFEACKKELREELNIDLDSVQYSILGMLNPHNDSVSAFMTVYEIRTDVTPAYNPDDFSEHYWLTAEEVLVRLEQGDTSKGDLPKLLKKFYAHEHRGSPTDPSL